MLIETLIICSLISQAPYYDCDNKWSIYIYNADGVGDACGSDALACAIYTPNRYDGEIHIPADYNHLPLSVSNGEKVYCDYCTDWCGNNILWHELQHLIIRTTRNCDAPQ